MRIGATRIEKDVREALALYEGVDIAPVLFHERAAYVTASITGRTAQETDPPSPAALEIHQLYTWICQQLHLSTIRQSEAETPA
jgi:chromosome partitioning protein